jgi:pimeloyl-ACP methyl ester carboxylesterase
MLAEDQFIHLHDGRILAYTEHGNPSGTPVFFIHGNPGSRLVRHPDESIAQNLGVRIITPDRPGYGLSTFQPKRRLLEFPDDIAQLADHLKLEQFAIFGVSAGGAYVAACAHKLPNRITQAAIVSGPTSFNRPDAYQGMGSAWRTAFRMSTLPEWLLRPILATQAWVQKRNPDAAVDSMAAILSESDQRILSQPDFRAGVMRRVPEATRKGARGWVREVKILLSPWGFDPSEIEIPVHLWYWEDDPAIPPQMGRYLEARIPNTIPHFNSGGGHLSLFDSWGEIIQALIGV